MSSPGSAGQFKNLTLDKPSFDRALQELVDLSHKLQNETTRVRTVIKACGYVMVDDQQLIADVAKIRSLLDGFTPESYRESMSP